MTAACFAACTSEHGISNDGALIVADAGTLEGPGSWSTLDGGFVGPLTPPPSPRTDDQPQPSATVAAPNLVVLPWAGFKAAITFTFDDSQPSHTEHWPELKAMGVPLTFFVVPSANTQPGYDANWSAIAASGSELGNHTWTHCHARLTDCTPIGSQTDEIDETTAYITSHLGVPAVYSFASPYGDTGWNSYAASRFLVGRGVSSGIVPASGVSDWYNLPVFAVTAGQTATDFNAGIDNARARGAWSIFLFHSLLPTDANLYAGVQMADVTASAAYGSTLGDVWMDTITAIGAYVRAKRMFEKLSPAENVWTWTLPEHFPPGKVLRVIVDGGTLSQGGAPLLWNAHGYYEIALDAGVLIWSP